MSILNPANPLKSGGSSSDSGVNLETHSSNEVRIGTWIDGKPLYRRCFNFTAPSATNRTLTVPFDASNILEVVNITGSAYCSNDKSWASGDTYGSTNYKLHLSVASDGLYVNPGTYMKSQKGHAIIEYTKTTD